jgi:alpha-ribazole phosphatase
MNIYFVRHGETEQNERKTFYGDIDAELNERGRQQCEKAARYLSGISFDKVFISERKRTAQSAEYICREARKDFIIDGRINEMSFGAFEGRTYEEIKELYPVEQKAWQEDWKGFCPPGGESYSMFYLRVKSFMEDIATLEEENILIVTHGGVIRTVYAYLMGENMDLYWKFASQNGDVTLIKYEYGNFFIDSIVHM